MTWRDTLEIGLVQLATPDSIGDAVLSTDTGGCITYLNPAAEEMTGWRSAVAAGRPFEEVCHIVDWHTGDSARGPTGVRLDLTARALNTVVRADGRQTSVERTVAPIHGRNGELNGTVVVLRNVDAALERFRQLLQVAQQDPLTGLPNRRVLHDRLTEAIELAQRHRRALAVLFIDVDGFKSVNDGHGHPAGDRFLQAVATRLSRTLRQSDTVSRCGGDEFVIVLSEIEHAEHAAAVGRKLAHAVSRVRCPGAPGMHVTASLGIAIYPDHGRDADTLIANADAAMYVAKRAGFGQSRLFEAGTCTARAPKRALGAHGRAERAGQNSAA